MKLALAAVLAAGVLAACSQPADAPLEGAALLERGDYLVNGVVLCGDCHTPHSETGEMDRSRELQGFEIGGPPTMATYAPPIAGIPGHFTEEQFTTFLQTGVRPDGSHPRPPMPPYRLNEADARAVTAYIANLTPASE